MENRRSNTLNAHYQREFYKRNPEKKKQYQLTQAIRICKEAGYILTAAADTDSKKAEVSPA